MSKTIVILYSHDEQENISADNEDTLIQLAEISEILKDDNYTVIALAFNNQIDALTFKLREINPCCVFNLVETIHGQIKLQYFSAAFLEFLGYSYTGCPAWSLAALASKTSVKQMLIQAGLPTPDFVSESQQTDSISHASKWLIKPDTEHASYGLDSNSIINLDVNTKVDLLQILTLKNQQSGLEWFAEKFISGREFNVSILENESGQMEVLVPVEMTVNGEQTIGDKILDYAAKWEPESEDYEIFVHKFDYEDSDKELIRKLMEISQRCCHLFGLRGAARIDYRVDLNNNPWVVDINANPCLTSDAGLMVAAARFAKLSQKEVILRLVRLASSQKLNREVKHKEQQC